MEEAQILEPPNLVAKYLREAIQPDADEDLDKKLTFIPWSYRGLGVDLLLQLWLAYTY